MELKSILTRIFSNNLIWRHVDDLPCVHTFLDNYYINLCSYKYEEKNIISIIPNQLGFSNYPQFLS